MVALGCCLRLGNPEWRPTRRWTVSLGAFAGVCLGLKVTLLFLAVVPVLHWLQRQPLTTPGVHWKVPPAEHILNSNPSAELEEDYTLPG